MDFQHHQLGVLPANDPALNTPLSETPFEGSSSQQCGVLQGRSANWPHDDAASITSTQHTSWKVSQNQNPTENVYFQQPTFVGNYLTSSLYTQNVGVLGCEVERPEKQINREITRLYRLLQRSEKYQKYREKQPVLTLQQLIEKEAKEAMMVEKDSKSPEKSVWPEFLEQAFWRALIRWPPMGRKKFMLDGTLRGRNELIQDSIYKDTGIRRDRKQVSSHLQVLKHHLKDQPDVLVYMAAKDEDTKRHRGKEAVASCHPSHLGGRHYPQQRVVGGSKYDYSALATFCSDPSSIQSSIGLGLNGETETSPYIATDFTILVEDGDKSVRDLTQLSQDGRLQDLDLTDTRTWHQQYPEFVFLQNQTEEWVKKQRKILVCDTSIKVMTETRPNVYISIAFGLHSQRDLRPFESLVCTTCFYSNGKMDADPQLGEPQRHNLREHCTNWEYTPDTEECGGRLRLIFSSRFLVNHILKYLSLQHKNESLAGRSPMKLTATQDVYGVNPSGTAECILTILWRFWQARDSAEAGATKWHTVSFGSSQSGPKQEWSRRDSLDKMSKELIHITTKQPQHPLSSNDIYHQFSSLGQLAHDSYTVHQLSQPPQLHMGTLTAPTTWPCTAPGLSQSSVSSAPSTTTGHSLTSPPNLPHSQGTASGFENKFDFSGTKGKIDLPEAFSPTVMASYKAFSDKNGSESGSRLEGLNALFSLGHESLLDIGMNANEVAQIGVTCSHSLQELQLSNVQSCYSAKPVPSWHQPSNLNSSLENAAQAETYRSL